MGVGRPFLVIHQNAAQMRVDACVLLQSTAKTSRERKDRSLAIVRAGVSESWVSTASSGRGKTDSRHVSQRRGKKVISLVKACAGGHYAGHHRLMNGLFDRLRSARRLGGIALASSSRRSLLLLGQGLVPKGKVIVVAAVCGNC